MNLTQKQSHFVFALIMVGTLTLIMSGVTTFVNSHFVFYFGKWMHNWIMAYAVALPCMLLLSPPIRKMLGKVTLEKAVQDVQ